MANYNFIGVSTLTHRECNFNEDCLLWPQHEAKTFYYDEENKNAESSSS
ncbi:hypothetical protein B2J93_3078 [Marssonina coronariae]|uniref:Uncharacterized protein n=1 Tax=Diplocarpon coronariae TaxID=2795749 RepID=A0A218ZHU0_9HELO|nr:hypothetical protein B2J93_3078 [Marssonina coronariae]